MTNTVFDFILLGLSIGGWAFFAYDRLRLNTAFIPIFVFSGITSFLFISGLLNILPFMVNLIFFSGLLLAIFYIIKFFRREYSIRPFLTPAIVFFVFMSLIFTILLKGVHLLHYDNFSHWGLILKEMFRIEGLPDHTTIIEFRNYPPGSAVFIYFIGKILVPGESHFLMAQGYLLSACLATLFVFSDWKKPLTMFLPLVSSITILSIIPGNIFDLLVDTLLGVVAIAAFIIAFYYKNDMKMSFIVNIPVLVLLILVKDSGKIFFAYIILFTLMLFLYNNRRTETFGKKLTKENLFSILGLVVIPLFTDFLWRQYVKKAYPTVEYESNKFALSIEKFSEISKSEEFIQNLGSKIVRAATDLNNKPFLVLVLTSALIFVLILALRLSTKKFSKVLSTSVVVTTIFYVIYIFSLYIMYLYLMPEGEAAYLAGFSRYQPTMIIFALGILLISFMYEYSQIERRSLSSILKVGSIIIMIVVILLPMKEHIFDSFSRPDNDMAIRLRVHEAYNKIHRYGKDGPKVIYYSPESENDRGYLRHILNYEQLNRKYNIVYRVEKQDEKENVLTLLKESDYIVVLKHDSNFQEFISEFSENLMPSNVYKIQRDGEAISLRPI